jgi:two-component system, OmpR family, sensor kinase
MRTLSQRILLVTLAGGVIVAVVTFALALPLVRDVARDEARDQLVRSVETFASRPAANARLLAREREALGPDDRRFVVVPPRGRVVGDDRGLLTPERIRALRTTGRLSASATIDGEEVLVEGRMTRRGFGAVGLQPAGSVDEATASFVRRLLLSVLIGLAAAGALGFVLSRTLTRSVGETAAVARRLAAGERGVPIGASSVSEIADMGHAIAALDEALSTSEGRQREFLLSVSHEIRTPLTALRGYAEALADGAIEPDKVRATGEVLVTETERIDRFVADLLALARLEADDFDLEETEVDVGALLDDLGAVWRASFERADVTLDVRSAAVTVVADPMRLRQLLDGLVENALRVAPEGGSVQVAVRRDGDDVVLEVEDDGPGLTSDDAEVAFERGSLRTKYAPHRPVGTGLGLSIARRLAERMDAELTAAAGSAGGAVFALRLPGATSRLPP